MYHEPCFVSYSPSVKLCHGIPVPVKTRPEDGFAFNMDEVRRAWVPGCKAIVINFPTNPTGGTAGTVKIPENWEDTSRVALGFHYYPEEIENLTIRIGAAYDESPVNGAKTARRAFRAPTEFGPAAA